MFVFGTPHTCHVRRPYSFLYSFFIRCAWMDRRDRSIGRNLFKKACRYETTNPSHWVLTASLSLHQPSKSVSTLRTMYDGPPTPRCEEASPDQTFYNMIRGNEFPVRPNASMSIHKQIHKDRPTEWLTKIQLERWICRPPHKLTQTHRNPKPTTQHTVHRNSQKDTYPVHVHNGLSTQVFGN